MPADEQGQTEGATPGTAPPARPPGEAPRAGDTIGRYVIERVLGAGGMGVVFAAHDPDLDRRVALKLLHANVAGAGPEARTRLLREARAMAKVNHPNVITVYEVGTAGGVDFVAMELVEGSNVADWLRSTQRPVEEILRVFRAAGRGLAAAHATGLVHRDFKPANVLVSHRGKVVVTDFGLARAFEGPDAPLASTIQAPAAAEPPPRTPPADARTAGLDETLDAGNTPGAPPPPSPAGSSPSLPAGRTGSADLSSTITRTGALLGTPAYMAPEQFRGQTAGPRADQYAYAVAVWEGLAGARPFRGTSFEELKQAVERGDAADVDRIPRRLRPVLIRGMSRALDDRYRNMDEMLDALERAERPVNTRVAAGVLAAIGLIAVGVLLLVLRDGRPRPDQVAAVPAAASCAISDADLEPAWSPAIAASIGEHLGDTAAWTKVRAALDAHAESWKAERRATCAEPTARDHHGRIACLLSMRDELQAITQMLPSIPPEALRGGSVSEVLTSPASCRTGASAARPALPQDPAIRAELSAVQRDGALARVAARAGRAEEARALATAAVTRARKLGEPVGLAGALESQATVEHVLGDCTAAEPLYGEAATVADGANASGLRAMAKIGHLECFMKRTSDLVKVRTLATEAEAAVKGAGGDDRLRAVLDTILADIDVLSGDLDRAITRITSAHQVFTEAKDLRRAGGTARSLAHLHMLRDAPGDAERAQALTREALARAESTYGSDHKQTQMARRALGFSLLQSDPEGARAMLAPLKDPPEVHPAHLPRVQARGRVLLPDGTPAAGARVYLGPFIIATDNGVPIEVKFAGTQPTVVLADVDGRFSAEVLDGSIGLAVHDDLRTPIFDVKAREQTIRLAPGVAAAGTMEVRRAPAPGPDAEPTEKLAARTSRVGAMVMAGGTSDARYQVFARTDRDGNWSARHLPPGTTYRAAGGVATMLGDKPVTMGPLPFGADGRGRAHLVLDLSGPALDVIVRADRAASIPTAQVMLFGGRLSPLPRDAEDLSRAIGKVERWSTSMAIMLDDSTHTTAGKALYQPGDIHTRFSSIGPGTTTICVIPFGGDVADDAFLRKLISEKDLETRCKVIDIPPTPRVQAVVIETPPMKRLTPRPD